MLEHTPTPFYLHGAQVIAATQLSMEDSMFVATVHGNGHILRERAEFIIRSCNNHDLILDELAAAADALEELTKGTDNAVVESQVFTIRSMVAEAKGKAC